MNIKNKPLTCEKTCEFKTNRTPVKKTCELETKPHTCEKHVLIRTTKPHTCEKHVLIKYKLHTCEKHVLIRNRTPVKKTCVN